MPLLEQREAVVNTENRPWGSGILKLEGISAVSKKFQNLGRLVGGGGSQYKLLHPGDLVRGPETHIFTYKFLSFSQVLIFDTIHFY